MRLFSAPAPGAQVASASDSGVMRVAVLLSYASSEPPIVEIRALGKQLLRSPCPHITLSLRQR